MRRLIATLLLILVCFSSFAGQRLTVVTWNLEWFPGGKLFAKAAERQPHVERVKAELAKIQPDILLVQEITDRGALEEALAGVSNLTLQVLSNFGSQIPGSSRIQNVGIASKLPAFSAWAADWEKGFAEPPRGYAFSAIQVATNELLMVYSLHMKSNLSRPGQPPALNLAKREDATKQLLAHIKETEPTFAGMKVVGVVVGGDMNTNFDNPEWSASEGTLRWIMEAGFWNCWADTPPMGRQTWMGNKTFTACTFDWIFTRGLGEPTAKPWPSPPEASDHRPVATVIELPD